MSALNALSYLGIRLLLTAHPGTQLSASSQLVAHVCAAAATAAAAAAATSADQAIALAERLGCALSLAVNTASQQLCSSSSNSSSNSGLAVNACSDWSVDDPEARLPALLSSLLAAAVVCSGCGSAGAKLVAQACCGVLQKALQLSVSVLSSTPAASLQRSPQQQQHRDRAALLGSRVLEAVRQLLQDTSSDQQQQQQTSGRSILAQLLVGAVVPQVRAQYTYMCTNELVEIVEKHTAYCMLHTAMGVCLLASCLQLHGHLQFFNRFPCPSDLCCSCCSCLLPLLRPRAVHAGCSPGAHCGCTRPHCRWGAHVCD